MNNPFLVGERVYLRALSLSDLEGSYVSWLNDPDVCRSNSHHVFPYTAAEAETFIRHAQTARDRIVLAVVDREKDLHIGNISLQKIDVISRSAEFAVLIGDRGYWGRGFATEAADLIVRHGFEALNLHRIHCGTFATNQGMCRLAATLGFKEEGRRREAFFKDGEFLDILEFGLLKADYTIHTRVHRRQTT
jgi:ribosomal-protein-alanine N-acetyltransferase